MRIGHSKSLSVTPEGGSKTFFGLGEAHSCAVTVLTGRGESRDALRHWRWAGERFL